MFCGKCGNKIINKKEKNNINKNQEKLAKNKSNIFIKNVILICTVILLAISIGLFITNRSKDVINSTQSEVEKLKNTTNNMTKNNETTEETNKISVEGKTVLGEKVNIDFKGEELNRFKDLANNRATKYFDIEYQDIMNKYGVETMDKHIINQKVYVVLNRDTKEIRYLLNFKDTYLNMIIHDSYNLIYENINQETGNVRWEFRTGGQLEYMYQKVGQLYGKQFAKYQSARDEDYNFTKSIVEKTNTDNIVIIDIDKF